MPQYKTRISDMPLEERPSSRLILKGPSSLSNSELLAIILKSGTVAENAISLSQRVLSQFDLKQLSAVDSAQLMKIHGIKSGKAAQIVACFELARRLESFDSSPKFRINSPEDVYRKLYPAMRESKKEYFVELCLDTKNHVIKEETISIGTLNANIVHPREVFRAAMISSAAHIIVAHNHPSGDPAPSREDIEITKKLVETGKIMGIEILDHVIIGDCRHFSMKEGGHI
ncbi:MAG: DNA repair protein RadC [Thermoleophilia bacterium]|nr:DNA repair protein RadC [Thermoleophilia bacterium]